MVDDNNEVIEQYEKDYTIKEKKDLINVAIEYIIETINFLKTKYNFSRFGLGMAGTIKNGIVLRSPNIGVEKFNIKKILEEKTNTEVVIENDIPFTKVVSNGHSLTSSRLWTEEEIINHIKKFAISETKKR